MAKYLHPKSRRPTAARTSIAPYFCNYVLKMLKTDPVFGKTAADREAFLAAAA